jgi:DNA polymerase I-like protein with 3'-5' exonuclease and polymerase domains
MFRPRPGWKQLGCDAAGLELRLFAAYLGNFDGGSYAKIVLEGDAHTSNQEAAGLDTRDEAKTFIYAFLYGAGNEKLGSIAGGGKRLGKELRDRFLERTPGLSDLVDAVKSGFRKRGFIYGLDRRRQYPRSEHSALNLLLQGAGAIVMKQALIELYFSEEETFGEQWDILINCHDEYQLEFDPELMIEDRLALYAEEAITKAGHHFDLKCRLDGEAQVGDSWYDCH